LVELDSAAVLAREKGSVGALVDIVLAKAKLIGLLVDRTESTHRNVVYAVSPEPIDPDTWSDKHASPPATSG
jgi:hypothetical protein